MFEKLVLYVTRQLVDKPDSVSVTESQADQTIVLKLHVDQEDRGKVIGKEGKMVRALRTLVHAAAVKEGKRAVLEIVD